MLQCNTDVTQEIDNRDQIKENKNKDIEIDKEDKTIIIKDDSLSDKNLEIEFEEIWKGYPNKKSKRDAVKHYKASRRRGSTFEEIYNGLLNYLNYIKYEKIDPHYIKHGSTWFCQECWRDEYIIAPKRDLKDISLEELEEAMRLEKERSGNL